MAWAPHQPKPFHAEVVVVAVELWELYNINIIFLYDKNIP